MMLGVEVHALICAGMAGHEFLILAESIRVRVQKQE